MSPHILLTVHRVRKCHPESLEQTLTDVSQKKRDLLYQQFVQCGSGAQLDIGACTGAILEEGSKSPSPLKRVLRLATEQRPQGEDITSGRGCVHQVVWGPPILIQPWGHMPLLCDDSGDTGVIKVLSVFDQEMLHSRYYV